MRKVSEPTTESRNRKEGEGNLGVLRLGDIDEDLCGGMENIEKLHDGSPVVGNGDVPLVVVNELVHTPGTQGCSNHVSDGGASVYVAH